MRRGDHAHVGLDRLVTADAIKLAIRQHAQQARLQIRRHVADFVEKQRAAVGLLETAAPHVLRPGKSAAFVSEQLRFEQVFRNRRGVDRDERLRRARAVTMQRARHQFLAGARIAGNQHRRMRLRQPADDAEHFLHRRRLTEDLGRRLRRFNHLILTHALFQRAPDQLDRVIDIERLRQVLVSATLKRRDRAFEIGIGGHDDDRHMRKARFRFLQQFEPGFARHANVADYYLRRFAGEHAERLVGRGEGFERDVLARQRLLEHPADRAVIINNPDRFHASSLPSIGSSSVNVVLPGWLSNVSVPWCCVTNVCASVSPRPLPPSRPDTSG